MAKQNTGLMLATYTTDFNTTITNIPLKFSADAPIPTGFYVAKTGNCTFPKLKLNPRYILAKFATGVHKYIVPSIGNINTLKTALITAGALCMDLYGETWTRVPNSVLSDPAPTPKAAPYAAADITGAGDRETGSFNYVSDLLGTVKAGYNYEAAPAALLTLQKTGLTSSAVGTGVQNRESLGIEPRHYIMKADVDDGTTIARKAHISELGDLATDADTIAPGAYYLAYQGENVYAIHEL